jgi:hypothetical protein
LRAWGGSAVEREAENWRAWLAVLIDGGTKNDVLTRGSAVGREKKRASTNGRLSTRRNLTIST